MYISFVPILDRLLGIEQIHVWLPQFVSSVCSRRVEGIVSRKAVSWRKRSGRSASFVVPLQLSRYSAQVAQIIREVEVGANTVPTSGPMSWWLHEIGRRGQPILRFRIRDRFLAGVRGTRPDGVRLCSSRQLGLQINYFPCLGASSKRTISLLAGKSSGLDLDLLQ